jgi:hypothetical protein
MIKLGTSEYRMIHYWIEKQLGKPMECSNCHTTSRNRYEWANISGEYKKDITDWKRLCKTCHEIMDNKNLCLKGHKLTEDNVYNHPTRGRMCRRCRATYQKEYNKKHPWHRKSLSQEGVE